MAMDNGAGGAARQPLGFLLLYALAYAGGVTAYTPFLMLVLPARITELAVEKGARTLLLPVTCRRQLLDLSDDMATEIDLQFYKDPKEALLKSLLE